MDKVTATRKFLKKEQWIKLIRECQSSGMTVTSWCKQNGIVEQTYYKNLKKLREELIENLPVPIEPEPQVPTISNVFRDRREMLESIRDMYADTKK